MVLVVNNFFTISSLAIKSAKWREIYSKIMSNFPPPALENRLSCGNQTPANEAISRCHKQLCHITIFAKLNLH